MGYLFGQLRSAVLAISPPKPLPTPSLLAFEGSGWYEVERALMLGELYLAAAKMLATPL